MILANNMKSKLYQYFTKRLGLFSYRRGWLKGDCPSCGEQKFGVNLSLNRTNCFKCGYNEKPLNVVMDFENLLNIHEAKNLINNLEGIKFKEQEYKPYELVETIKLPEGYRNVKRGTSYLSKLVRRFIKSRGFNLDEVSRRGWGYCASGDYFGYLIMPFYEKGQLVYYNARKVVGNGPKFNNPPVEDFGMGKSMLIYNIDALDTYKRVFIFEGLMNAATIGDNAIAMGGKKLSAWQINKMIKSSTSRFVICLDDDAIEDSFDLALKLSLHKKVKLVEFPEKKDANDLGKNETMKLIRKFKYESYNGIKERKIRYEATKYTHN